MVQPNQRPQVTVWHLDLGPAAPERARAAWRRRANAGLKQVLGSHLGVDPSDIELEKLESGKPVVKERQIHFNLSHSGERALVAVSKDCDVGVDLELVRARAIATKGGGLSHQEQALIDGLEAAERINGFYRLWTAKEAAVKLTGEGFSALGSVQVGWQPLHSGSSDGQGGFELTSAGSGNAQIAIIELDAGPGWAACLAAPAGLGQPLVQRQVLSTVGLDVDD